MRANDEAIEYYQLGENASFREMVAHVRADEACHRDLNHHFADTPIYAEIDHHDVEVVMAKSLCPEGNEETKQKIVFKDPQLTDFGEVPR